MRRHQGKFFFLICIALKINENLLIDMSAYWAKLLKNSAAMGQYTSNFFFFVVTLLIQK